MREGAGNFESIFFWGGGDCAPCELRNLAKFNIHVLLKQIVSATPL